MWNPSLYNAFFSEKAFPLSWGYIWNHPIFYVNVTIEPEYKIPQIFFHMSLSTTPAVLSCHVAFHSIWLSIWHFQKYNSFITYINVLSKGENISVCVQYGTKTHLIFFCCIFQHSGNMHFVAIEDVVHKNSLILQNKRKNTGDFFYSEFY